MGFDKMEQEIGHAGIDYKVTFPVTFKEGDIQGYHADNRMIIDGLVLIVECEGLSEGAG